MYMLGTMPTLTYIFKVFFNLCYDNLVIDAQKLTDQICYDKSVGAGRQIILPDAHTLLSFLVQRVMVSST